MQAATILVVDDESLIRYALTERLTAEGYRVLEAETVAGALAKSEEGVDLVLLDYRLPDGDGLAVLKRIKERDPDTLVILLTAYSSVETAVEAIKQGAYHYVNKPFNLDEIVLLVERALETTHLRREVRSLRASQAQPYSFERIVGDAPALAAVKALLKKVASSPASTVLLTGESGTGKTWPPKSTTTAAVLRSRSHHLLGAAKALMEAALRARARRVHRRIDRSGDCSRRRWRRCFLTRSARWCRPQAKLLRFLEEDVQAGRRSSDIHVDVRVISANRHLRDEVKEGRFREVVLPVERAAHQPAAAARARRHSSLVTFASTLQRRIQEESGCRLARGDAAPRHMPGQATSRVAERRRARDAVADGDTLRIDDFAVGGGGGAKLDDKVELPAEGINLDDLERSWSSRPWNVLAGTRRKPHPCSVSTATRFAIASRSSASSGPRS
jgi:DNA-binding response OmpR family regulator